HEGSQVVLGDFPLVRGHFGVLLVRAWIADVLGDPVGGVGRILTYPGEVGTAAFALPETRAVALGHGTADVVALGAPVGGEELLAGGLRTGVRARIGPLGRLARGDDRGRRRGRVFLGAADNETDQTQADKHN